ncbi:MAG: hypothetical protein ACLTZT_02550 [Butyricimonas faecalis]
MFGGFEHTANSERADEQVIKQGYSDPVLFGYRYLLIHLTVPPWYSMTSLLHSDVACYLLCRKTGARCDTETGSFPFGGGEGFKDTFRYPTLLYTVNVGTRFSRLAQIVIKRR